MSDPSAAAFMLTGRVAAVTGAGSGIGRAIATEYVRAGATVHCLDRDADAAAMVADELTHACFSHECQVIDVTPSNIESVLARLEAVLPAANVAPDWACYYRFPLVP